MRNAGTPDFSTGRRSKSTTSTWNSSPQRELSTNPLSGKLGADHTRCGVYTAGGSSRRPRHSVYTPPLMPPSTLQSDLLTTFQATKRLVAQPLIDGTSDASQLGQNRHPASSAATPTYSGPDVAGERKVTVGARPGLGRANSPAPGLGSALSELRRLNAELLAAAGQLKPVTIEALLRGGPGTG